ncbi:MAG: hypothetical protein Q9163_005061 [Psora crenata]
MPHTPDTAVPHAHGFPAWFASRADILKPILAWDKTDILKCVLQNTLLRTISISLVAPFIYGLFIRRTAWNWSLSVAALLWDVPHSRLSYIPPHYPSLVYKSISAGLLLNFLWHSSNALFTTYVARQPIKKEQPLSSESKDPTGTLLNGLKSKREIPKTFAFWELSLITSSFPDRRKAIFTDIDRPSGAAWSQISTLCLNNLASVNSRINEFLNPTAEAPKPTSLTQQQPGESVETLPRLSTPLKQENIFAKPPPPSSSLEKLESNVGTIAKSYGQSPSPGTVRVLYSPKAKTLLSSGSHKLLSSPATQKLLESGLQKQLSRDDVQKLVDGYKTRFLRSRFGRPFRQTFARRVRAVVLGCPYSDYYPLITSIKAHTALARASIEEDPYGCVAKDIPNLIRTYCTTVETIEAFVRNLPPHWTDVDFKENDRIVEETATLVECMKSGIGDILQSFGQFASELGIGPAEAAAARRIAGSETKS